MPSSDSWAGVSVIIPTYNRADLVLGAVSSVMRQVDVPLEIIVVDDHSTDATEEVLGEVPDQIRFVRMPLNVERGAARNAGARVATHPYLAFLDSDDYWDAAKLTRQMSCIVGHSRALCLTDAIAVEGERTRRLSVPKDFKRRLPLENLSQPSRRRLVARDRLPA